MAEVPSSYEDAGMVDSTAVDYQMARDNRNPSIDSEFVNGTAAEEEEESGNDVKEMYGRIAGCTEDGRDGWIRAMEYAGGNRTRKRGGSAERSEEKGEMRNV